MVCAAGAYVFVWDKIGWLNYYYVGDTKLWAKLEFKIIKAKVKNVGHKYGTLGWYKCDIYMSILLKICTSRMLETTLQLGLKLEGNN